MRLSTKTRYALRAMMQLALHEGAGPVQLREIARAQRLPPKYLEQLATALRHAGLVRTKRGTTGGYELARPSAAISALDVVQAVEGPLALLDCIGRASACSRSGSCAARDLWVQVQDAIGGVLSRTTLAQLQENQQSLTDDQPLCYQI